MVLHRTAGASGSGAVSGAILRSPSDMAALAQIRSGFADSAAGPAAAGPKTPRTPQKRGLGSSGRSSAAAARRRRRALLWQLLAVAATIAMLTGCFSVRMHAAIDDGDAEDDGGDGGGAGHGWRRWLGSTPRGSRRSLREGPAAAAPGLHGLRDPGAQGMQLHEQWWLIGGASPVALEQQQQDEAIDGSVLAGLVRPRRLQPAAMRVYDLAERQWTTHQLTRFPPELPVARWAVASLLNRAKKKESSVFLVGGLMSAAEAAAASAAALEKREEVAGGGAAAAAGSAALQACPLASAAAFSLNTGRGKVRALPPLPAPRYGGVAVVVGARLHFFGGWATPDRASRLAVPAAEHWSIGLNADGSSAPEWQDEAPVPAELRGVAVRALALSAEDGGEPAVHAWAAPSAGSASGLDASANPACFAEGDAGMGGGRRAGDPLPLWTFAASSGWQQRGTLPKPLAADFQCAAAASPHVLLAVGGAERSGLFTRQRPIWQYDARQAAEAGGDGWTRVGWAPLEFQGHLCALHRGRLFVNTALPPEPALSDDALEADAAAEDRDARRPQQEQPEQAQPEQAQPEQAQQQQPGDALPAAAGQPEHLDQPQQRQRQPAEPQLEQAQELGGAVREAVAGGEAQGGAAEQ